MMGTAKQRETNLKWWKAWREFRANASPETVNDIDKARLEWLDLPHATSHQPTFRLFMGPLFRVTI